MGNLQIEAEEIREYQPYDDDDVVLREPFEIPYVGFFERKPHIDFDSPIKSIIFHHRTGPAGHENGVPSRLVGVCFNKGSRNFKAVMDQTKFVTSPEEDDEHEYTSNMVKWSQSNEHERQFIQNCELDNTWLETNEFFAWADISFEGLKLAAVKLTKITIVTIE